MYGEVVDGNARLTALVEVLQRPPAVVCAAADADVIITDTGAPPDIVGSLRAAGLEVQCV